MARRIPKFPLKMANGANVRSIEELRENADIESIVNYFLSGQLSRWCRAFGYDNLPDKLENVTSELVRNIYEALEIPVDEPEIRQYLDKHGIGISANRLSENNAEIQIADSTEIKLDYEILKKWLCPDEEKANRFDFNTYFSYFEISVNLEYHQDEKSSRYCVEIFEKMMEQYSCFVLPYHQENEKNSSDFLYQNISNVMKNMMGHVIRICNNTSAPPCQPIVFGKIGEKYRKQNPETK